MRLLKNIVEIYYNPSAVFRRVRTTNSLIFAWTIFMGLATGLLIWNASRSSEWDRQLLRIPYGLARLTGVPIVIALLGNFLARAFNGTGQYRALLESGFWIGIAAAFPFAFLSIGGAYAIKNREEWFEQPGIWPACEQGIRRDGYCHGIAGRAR